MFMTNTESNVGGVKAVNPDEFYGELRTERVDKLTQELMARLGAGLDTPAEQIAAVVKEYIQNAYDSGAFNGQQQERYYPTEWEE